MTYTQFKTGKYYYFYHKDRVWAIWHYQYGKVKLVYSDYKHDVGEICDKSKLIGDDWLETDSLDSLKAELL